MLTTTVDSILMSPLPIFNTLDVALTSLLELDIPSRFLSSLDTLLFDSFRIDDFSSIEEATNLFSSLDLSVDCSVDLDCSATLFCSTGLDFGDHRKTD